MIQGNDFSIIASTAHGPKPPDRHLHGPLQDGARDGSRALRLEARDVRGAAARRTGARPARRLRRLRDRGEGRGRPAARAAERERLDARRRRASPPRPRSTGARDGRRLGARRGRRREPPAGGRARGRRSRARARPRRSRSSCTRTPGACGRSDGCASRARREPLPVRTAPGLEPPAELVDGAGLEPDARARRSSRPRSRSSTAATAPELQPARAAPARGRARAPGASSRTCRSAYVTTALGARRRCACCRAATGWTTRARSVAPARPAVPAAARRPAAAAPRASTSRAGSPRARTRSPRACSRTGCGSSCFGQGLSRTRRGPRRAGRVADASGAARLAGASSSRDSGWDVKRLLRTLVTSATYRQTLARSTPTLVETRPREPALRAPVAASGSTPSWCATTRSRCPGSSRRARRPERLPVPARRATGRTSTSRRASGTPRRARTSTGAGSTPGGSARFPQPSLVAFDAPSREECTGERVRSNVPQQALVLLNDPTLRRGGARLRRAHPARRRPERRVAAALRLRARAAARAERGARSACSQTCCAASRRAVRARSRGGRAARRDRPVRARRDDLDPVELAAWTQVARAILNLPELVTRS